MTAGIRALRIVLALAIVLSLIEWVGPEGLFERIAACPWPAALAAFSTTLLAQWLGATRLCLLARSQALPLTQAQAMSIGLSAVFYGLFLPGGSATGWVVRLLRLAPSASGIGTALVVLSADRAVTTAIGAVIGVIAGFLMTPVAHPLVTVLLFAIACGAACFGALLLKPSLEAWVARGRRLPGLRTLMGSLAGVPARRPAARTIWLAIALSLALHAAGVVSWLLLARGLGLETGVVALAWVRSAALVVTLLPASVGGLGLREGAVIFLMSGMGIASVEALTLSLLVFAVTVLAIGVVGGILEAARLVTRPPVARA